MIADKNDARKVFREKGTCSRTFCYLLDREFGCLKENEERASDPLAGGILKMGHQCGMLWGASLGAGAVSFRRYGEGGQAVAAAVTATQCLMESFSRITGTVDCRDVTGCDLTTRSGMAKLMLKNILCGFVYSRCFNLAKKWAPEAIRSVGEGLSREQGGSARPPVSCASEVVRKMGGGGEEAVMAAGFAGGLGLSGNACGALAAAVWMKTLVWCRANPGQPTPLFDNPDIKDAMKAFYSTTGSKILCREVTGRRFESMDDHTEFIHGGGCAALIDVLAR